MTKAKIANIRFTAEDRGGKVEVGKASIRGDKEKGNPHLHIGFSVSLWDSSSPSPLRL
jgi:hypothetical protein